MMINLFSVFDPSSYFNISFNWLIMILIFMVIPVKYFLMSSGIYLMMKSLILMIMKIFCEISYPNYMALSLICTIFFLYLAVSNLMGLFPFIFTSMAHPFITMGMGLVMWMTFFLMGWSKNFKCSAAHLVPLGTPMMLAPLMVIIESISHLIRPFTLSIRLAANMMAGHLIIGLLSMISITNYFNFSVSLFIQSMLLVLEFGVSIIQGFVFSILLMLYALEYY